MDFLLAPEVWTLFVDITKWMLTVSFFVLIYGCVWVLAVYQDGKKEMRKRAAQRAAQRAAPVKVYHLPKVQRR